MSKIVITGSSGFIGSHLKNRFDLLGHEVICWDRVEGKDIHDFELEPDTDFVIHLAADADVGQSIESPDQYWHNNVTPTTRIQRICDEYAVPLIYASSSCIHNWYLSPYGITKKVNEETARDNQVGLRFTTVYGDGARDVMFIGKLMRGELQYATNHIRDFIHVDDVISAIEIIMVNLLKGLTHPTYDIGTGHGNIVSDLAKIRYPNIAIQDGNACEAHDNTANTDKICALGWKANVSVVEYLRCTSDQ
jgi:nucleoside-diphosphate-sugar epimerase